jgi:hypothetical protein
MGKVKYTNMFLEYYKKRNCFGALGIDGTSVLDK